MKRQIKVADKLRQALELFGPNGDQWVNHSPITPHTYCMVEAVFHVVNGQSGSFVDCLHEIEQVLPHRPLVQHWNDMPGRKFSEVRDVFMKAIHNAEELNLTTEY